MGGFWAGSGDGTAQNVAADFKKISIHPIMLNSKAHQPLEDLVEPSARHVTCVDCHNPHVSNGTPGTALTVAKAVDGVRGVNAAGGLIQNVTREYELCFRCHGDMARLTQIAGPHQICGPNGFNCSTCHDPHGKYRRDNTGTIATTGKPIKSSGSYNNSSDPDANFSVGVYRLLGGIG